MVLASLKIAPLEIPLRSSFKHHSAERKTTQAVLVTAESAPGSPESATGLVGMGEGCPREYVTGESVATCLDFFARYHDELAACEGPEALARWADGHEGLIDKNPAAWCAMELALLDLFSKERSQSVEKTLGVPELAGSFAYTAVLGDSVPEVYQAQARKYLALGFSDFKVKISGNLESDQAKIAFLQAEARGPISLRLDANNLWKRADEVAAYLAALPLLPFAIEEPLAAFDFAGLAEICVRCPVKIILDESFLNCSHFQAIRGWEENLILNVRVSKMGGLRRSLQVAEAAGRLGVPVIVGAQVGETSLLSRAALTVANACRGNLLAQEGAYGTLLLERDVTERPVMFGKGGKLHPAELLEPGCHGLQIRYRSMAD